MDERRFKQIIINLLSNAIKFTKEGSVRVVTLVKEKRAFIKVIDTGIGIRKEELAKLFAEFYTVKESQSINPNGTGLGLYLSRNLARLMNGDIKARSKYDSGTKFIVHFPIDENAPTDQVMPKDESISLMNLNTSKNILTGVTLDHIKNSGFSSILKSRGTDRINIGPVLVVEDSLINAYVLRKLVEKYLLSSMKAGNGKEAIDLVLANREQPFSLIIMDINMPIMNGLEVNCLISIGSNSIEEDDEE